MTSRAGRVLCAVGAFMALLAGLSSPALAEKRVALVIGNDAYQNVPALKKAVNDSRTIGDSLKQLGFTVVSAQNLTRTARVAAGSARSGRRYVEHRTDRGLFARSRGMVGQCILSRFGDGDFVAAG